MNLPCSFTRRRFALTGAAATAGLLLGLPAGAETAKPAKAEGWVLPEEFKPRIVRLRGDFVPGMILVDPNQFALFLTQDKGKAIRYAVGIAKGDLYEGGNFFVGAKKEWPSWTPTAEMIERSPEHYAKYKDGMPGGPGNPLGARALYLFDKARGDTFLRIHGTTEPWTIGSAVSNGCVRLVNSHVEHLYDKVEIGAPVVLYPKRAAA